jgi:acid phosphatase type 7
LIYVAGFVAASTLTLSVALAASLGVTSARVTMFATCTLRAAPADTDVDQGSATSNFGTSSDLYVRSKSGNANRRTFVRFDLASCSIPSGAQVTSARLSFYLTGAPGQSRTYEARRVNASWVETTMTWNNQPAVAGVTSIVATGTTSDVRLEWNVAADVQAFVSGSATNNGWRISDQTEGAATSPESKFASAEHGTSAWQPRLLLAYYP